MPLRFSLVAAALLLAGAAAAFGQQKAQPANSDVPLIMPGRTTNAHLMEFGKRVGISQTDEVNYMKRWLTNRNKPLSEMGDMASMAGAGMDMSGMAGMAMPLMPGMLTPAQMDELRKAKGTQFDHLFLTGTIQHHGGALTMVDNLFNTPNAGQDPQLFDFTADISATRAAEINAMQDMLAQEKK
jgi:uncharacterized protein (DUF305 family)